MGVLESMLVGHHKRAPSHRRTTHATRAISSTCKIHLRPFHTRSRKQLAKLSPQLYKQLNRH